MRTVRKEANAAPMATTVVKAGNVVHSAAIESASLMVIVAKVVTETVNHTVIVAKAAKEDPTAIVERAVKDAALEATEIARSVARSLIAERVAKDALLVTESASPMAIGVKAMKNALLAVTAEKEGNADLSTARTSSAKVAKSAVDVALRGTAIRKKHLKRQTIT